MKLSYIFWIFLSNFIFASGNSSNLHDDRNNLRDTPTWPEILQVKNFTLIGF